MKNNNFIKEMKNSVFFQVLIRVLKKTKLSSLLMLIVLLSLNTAAWFIYATKVDNSIGAKIVAWNVSFVSGEEELLEYINFEIDNVYPGMEEYYKEIIVSNDGETAAELKYEIISSKILGNEIIVNEENGITSSMLLSSLKEDYPFKINISASNYEISKGTSEKFYVTVSWPFESGDDEADTYWGNLAYDFHEKNKNVNSIELKLVLSAVQKAKE